MVSLEPGIASLGVLAFELSPEGQPGEPALSRDEAEALGSVLAEDLRRLLPGIDALDAGLALALFDPAELLRPGWPVHAALAELAGAAPGRRGGRLIAFGSHDGRMPADALQPDPALGGGLLRLVPFVLLGDADALAPVAEAMEAKLLDVGMASAQAALDAQAAFGVQLEHARWMSVHDLCAMTAMQYGHAGLEAHWRLIEAALLAPDGEEWLREDGEPLARYAGGEVRIAEIAAADDESAADLRRATRRLVAILSAHGIAHRRVAAADLDEAERALRADD
jgi:hypothetical protein